MRMEKVMTQKERDEFLTCEENWVPVGLIKGNEIPIVLMEELKFHGLCLRRVQTLEQSFNYRKRMTECPYTPTWVQRGLYRVSHLDTDQLYPISMTEARKLMKEAER